MRVLDDRWVIVLAAATVAGASLPAGIPWPVPALAIAISMLGRARLGLVVCFFVLASALAHDHARAVVAIDPGPFESSVALVTDPIRSAGGVRVDVMVDGVRYEAAGWGAAGARLRDRLAGEHVELIGTVRSVGDDPYRLRRGVDGVISVDTVGSWSSAGGPSGAANMVRRLLAAGAEPLPLDDQALFLGIVFGDDREMSVVVKDDFRAAGLTHLVAVSGQNVAFVLALAGPVLRRLQVHSRWALTLALLGFFGLVTRFEPSVVRATAMAGVAATATLLGRESSATRSLGLAISGLILLDPGLISSLGFRLSVAATMGILWISPGLARMFPGPRVVRETSAITVGAQLAVAPMLVTTFGSVPVASVPANLLAGPAAGPVMIWGLSGGLVAGLVGGTVGTVLHWPTGLLTRWMRWVARLAAVAPFGQLTPVPLMAATIAVTFLLVGRHRRTAAAVAIAFLLLPSVDIIAAGDGRADPTAGVAIWRAEGVTVVEVDGSATAARALAALRTEGIRSVDMVVAHEDGRRVAEVLAAVGRRHRIVAIVTASGSERDWLSLGDGEQVGIGPVVISAVGGDLVVAWAS